MEQFKYPISEYIGNNKKKKINFTDYETSFRRWLVSELDGGRMSLLEAIERFKLPANFKDNYRSWQKSYSEKFHLSLHTMTSEELTNQKELEARINELETQLRDAQITNVGLNTMIEIAEKDLKISIKKKSNTKQ